MDRIVASLILSFFTFDAMAASPLEKWDGTYRLVQAGSECDPTLRVSFSEHQDPHKKTYQLLYFAGSDNYLHFNISSEIIDRGPQQSCEPSDILGCTSVVHDMVSTPNGFKETVFKRGELIEQKIVSLFRSSDGAKALKTSNKKMFHDKPVNCSYIETK